MENIGGIFVVLICGLIVAIFMAMLEFLSLTYVEPKHQSSEHNQAGANDFQRLIWIF